MDGEIGVFPGSFNDGLGGTSVLRTADRTGWRVGKLVYVPPTATMPLGGLCQYGKNDSGGALADGDAVIRKASTTDVLFTTTTSANDALRGGVAIETIADQAYGLFLVFGLHTGVDLDGTTDVAAGDPVSTFTTAKALAKATSNPIGIAMEAWTSNSVGQKAVFVQCLGMS